jgi:homoserine kinase type II
MRQNYPFATLQEVLNQFPNIGTIKESNLFTSGFENSNYYIKTEQGEYVIKVFEGIDISSENIIFETEVMNKLFNAGIKSPKIFSTKDHALYIKFAEKHAILMGFIAGKNLEKNIISDTLAEQIGEQTGRMDTALSTIRDSSKTRQNYEFDLKNFLILQPKIDKLDKSFNKKIFNKIFDLFKRIKPELETVPAGLIQNDIVLHNIIAKGDELQGIIDFSDMAFSPYAQNVAIAFCQCFFSYNWQPHQAKIFLDAYQRFHPLSTREKNLLYILTLARFATLIIEGNYWDISLGKDLKRTNFIKDNYNFLNRFLLITESDFHKIIN